MRNTPLLIFILILFPQLTNAHNFGKWMKLGITEDNVHFLLSNGYYFGGIATPATSPSKSNSRIYYLAGIPGVYRNFKNVPLDKGESAIICSRYDRVMLDNIPSSAGDNPCVIRLSSCKLHNGVITKESGWQETTSDITVLSDYIKVSKGTGYIPHYLGDYRLTIYHYDKNKNFLDISSWFTLKESFIALGDYIKVGVRKTPFSKISAYAVEKQGIEFFSDVNRIAKMNMSGNQSKHDYTLVFEDDFNSFDETKWEKFDSSNPPFSLSFGQAPFKSENISVKDGCLVIEARKGNCNVRGRHYPHSTGMVDTRERFVIGCGKVEAKIRAGYCQGYNAGFWLNPQFGRWPEGQEIDIVEITKKDLAAGSLHYTSGASHQNTEKPVYDNVITWPLDGKVDLAEWHIWGCEWDADEIRYYCDNVLYGIIRREESQPDMAFDQSGRYIVLSYGMGKCDFERKSYRMLVDWVRVYSSESQANNADNEILLEYDMNHPLTMNVGEWRGLYPRLVSPDGRKWASLKLNIVHGKDNVVSMGSSNMVLFSKGKGTAVCEVSGSGMNKRFKVIVK